MADEQQKTKNKLPPSQLIKRALNETRIVERKNDRYTLIEKPAANPRVFVNVFLFILPLTQQLLPKREPPTEPQHFLPQS